jgi:hypothetical protein
MEQNKQENTTVVHDDSNTWEAKGKVVPLSEMSEKHLRAAKKYAQRMEEYHHFKSGEFSEKVEKLEAEAERRGIKLADYRSKFHKNTKRFKEYVKQMPEDHK